ncbi:MAG TPA: histidine phosphatase family protein [Anaerolineales bacterium]
MPLFLLIRHGENDYVKKGRLAGRMPAVHLNKKGVAQAQVLADYLVKRLAGNPVKVIYSSPLERAMETAEPIAKSLSAEVHPLPGLIETEPGEWTGRSLKSLRRKKEWRKVQTTPALFRFPQGESIAEAQFRICQELKELAASHGDKDTLICISHSDPIKLAIAYFIGLPLDQYQRLQVNTASINALFIGELGSHLVSLNFEPLLCKPE